MGALFDGAPRRVPRFRGARPGRRLPARTIEICYRATFMVTDLKVTTRRGYDSVLDLDLSKRGLSRSTRNNVQIVLRSVLRFPKEKGAACSSGQRRASPKTGSARSRSPGFSGPCCRHIA